MFKNKDWFFLIKFEFASLIQYLLFKVNEVKILWRKNENLDKWARYK